MADRVLDEIYSIIRGIGNDHVRQWKDSGRPVVGYFCHYSPPEIVLAAGALPFRLRGTGSDDSSAGDAYMSGRICTYVRHVMSLALEGGYDFLDGEICLNTCDHVRRAADVFVKKTDVPFNAFISVPRNPRESLFGYYLSELKNLVSSLESHFGVSIGDDELRPAIRAFNENRRLLKKIEEFRLPDEPKLTGAEALSIHIASHVLPPSVFADIAGRLLDKLPERPGLDSSRGRLVLTGGELDEPGFVAAIESQGALVVADTLCFGARSLLEPIDEDSPDPLEAIARKYFFSNSCARMIGDFPERWDTLKDIMDTCRADGIVFQRLVFCDPWGAEIHNMLHRAAQEDGIPVLSLTREYGIVATGQLRTRAQAFVEKIEIARAKKSAGSNA